jgi:hypothetical protein
MVVIDDADIGKARKEVLLDLIYESTEQRIPIEKIKFGTPRKVDPRLDEKLDHNTFIPVYVDPEFDSRYGTADSGFLYRRRMIVEDNALVIDLSNVQPFTLPFRIGDVLDQINTYLGYDLHADDIINHQYTSLEDVEANGVKLEAHDGSLLWVGEVMFLVNTSKIRGEQQPLIINTQLNGFNEWMPLE